MDVVFLGPPGAGKGTQAREVSRRLGICHISTGDVLRQAIRTGSPLGMEAGSFMERGELVPDQLVDRLVDVRLGQPECADGCLLDGYPRNLAQAQTLERMEAARGRSIKTVMVLEVADEIVKARLGGRRSCPRCGAMFHVTENPPQAENLCDACGEELRVRPDDRPEVVADRLRVYHSSTAPLLEYYHKSGVVVSVDGAAGIAEVTAAVVRALRSRQ